MAIGATCVWEVRTTGSQNNGGGYTSGGTDYSQQTAAQLSPTDLACLDTSTTLTSAVGGFTVAMVGNIIHITAGTNFTVGWYEITAYTDTNTVTIDRTAAAAGLNATAGVGKVGGAFLLGGALDDDWLNSVVAGNTAYVKLGSYSLGEAFIYANSGTAVLPITFEGYNATRGDNPTGANRPTIAAAAFACNFGSFYTIKNFIFTTTAAYGAEAEGASWFINCKSTNSSATAGRNAFRVDSTSGGAINCEIISTNGTGISVASSAKQISYCYIHDSVTGIATNGGNDFIVGCVIDTCTTGISVGANANISSIGNTIYNCTTGISGTTGYGDSFINNIISGCTTGASWTTATLNNYWDYNCWNNTTDVSNVTKGSHDITADPLLNAPATGDFTLASGSPCFNAGMTLGANVGL